MRNDTDTKPARPKLPAAPRLPTVAVVVLLVAAGAAVYQARAAAKGRERADRRRHLLAQCRDLVDRIAAIRTRPMIARQYAESSEGLNELVEQCLAAAKVPSRNLVAIRPLQPMRVGRSDYLEDSATVALQEVTLEQVVRVLAGIRARRPQMHVKSLDINPVRDNAKQWEVDVQLAALIYDPIIQTNARANQ